MADALRPRTDAAPPESGATAAGWSRGSAVLLWFGVLGGAIAWAVHEVSSWLLVELTCRSGHEEVLGIGLRWWVAAATAVPLAVALTALAVAWRAEVQLRRRLDAPPRPGDRRRVARARFLAQVGGWMDAAAVLMILFDAAAVATLPACAT